MPRCSACESTCACGQRVRQRPWQGVWAAFLGVAVLGLGGCGTSGPLYTTADDQATTLPLSYAAVPSVTTAPPVAGQPMTVTFTVGNNTYHILYAVPWIMYLDGDSSQIIASGSIVQITPNGETAESVQVTAPSVGTHTLTVVIDPHDVLQLGEASGPASTITVVTVVSAPV